MMIWLEVAGKREIIIILFMQCFVDSAFRFWECDVCMYIERPFCINLRCNFDIQALCSIKSLVYITCFVLRANFPKADLPLCQSSFYKKIEKILVYPHEASST